MQNTYANECFLDELAAAANADPIEFRLKYLDPADKRGIETLNRVATLAKWDKRPSPQQNISGNVVKGRGVSGGTACTSCHGPTWRWSPRSRSTAPPVASR